VQRAPATLTVVPTTVEEMLAAARAKLRRLPPTKAHAAMRNGAELIDIRSDSQRTADGTIPGASFVPRNVLEWRLDPACPHRDARLTTGNGLLVLICDEGYQSSLAAASVQRFGQRPVTDVIGGFRAWRAQGLPVERAM
jgi:rhodanese-related sulfurtransferase